VGVEGPWCVFSEKASQWNNNVGIPCDETSVKVCKTKERLNITVIARFRPVKDYLDLVLVHLEAHRRTLESKEFNGILFPLALLWLCIKAMLS
jgi:hypothetical protein